MRTRLLVRMILLGALAGGLCSQLQSLALARGQTQMPRLTQRVPWMQRIQTLILKVP